MYTSVCCRHWLKTFNVTSPVFDDECTDGGGDDLRAAHVSHTKQQLILAIASTDDSQTTEHDRVCSLLGPRQLGEYETSHQGLDEYSDTRLKNEHKERYWTFRLDDPEPNKHTLYSADSLLVNNNRKPIGIIYSAAFDTVDHEVLLKRLRLTFGIDNSAHPCFQSYLSGRHQHVRRGSTRSTIVHGLWRAPRVSSRTSFTCFVHCRPHLVDRKPRSDAAPVCK